MNKNQELINAFYESAKNCAICEVEALARNILRRHPNLDEFVMGMGTYFFKDKNGEIVQTHSEKRQTNGGYIMQDTFKYFAPLNNFMNEWEDIFCLSGYAMRFTAYGEIITNW